MRKIISARVDNNVYRTIAVTGIRTTVDDVAAGEFLAQQSDHAILFYQVRYDQTTAGYVLNLR
jgi:hypothetical protein